MVIIGAVITGATAHEAPRFNFAISAAVLDKLAVPFF